MDLMTMTLMILLMAAVTFILRMLPLTFVRKKIKSTFICSLLFYIPYAVLSAMTFPFVLYCTQSFYTALIGTVVAIIASSSKMSLIIVAILACLAVFATGFIFY